MFGLRPEHVIVLLIILVLLVLVGKRTGKGAAIWAILSLAFGIIAAWLFNPLYATRLGWPAWLVFIILFLDVALVLYAPLQAREYYAAWKLNQMGPTWSRMVNTSPLQLFVLTLIFIIAPVVVLLLLLALR